MGRQCKEPRLCHWTFQKRSQALLWYHLIPPCSDTALLWHHDTAFAPCSDVCRFLTGGFSSDICLPWRCCRLCVLQSGQVIVYLSVCTCRHSALMISGHVF